MLNILHHYFGTKLLNKIDPEISHSIALCYLRLLNQFVKKKEIGASILKTQIAGMEVPSPIGLAAGFDKNAEVFNATLSLGCLLYTSPSPRDRQKSRMPSSA